MKYNKLLVLFILMLFISCVRYSFRGALPSYLKNLYIEDFDNRTQYPEVREEFMRKVTEAFITDNSLKIIDDAKSADLILSGAITSIPAPQPVSITQQEQVQEFKMVVNVKAECLNTHTDKPLWSGNLSDFGLISGSALSDEIDLAISDAIDKIVEEVINKTIAAW